jgi:hypothetical protein
MRSSSPSQFIAYDSSTSLISRLLLLHWGCTMGYTFVFLDDFDKKEKQIFLRANKYATADQLFYAVNFVQSWQCRSAKPANVR